MTRAVCTIAIALLVLLFVGAQAVGAHAVLVRSEPAANSVVQTAPQRVVMEFTERPDLGFSRIYLLDDTGQRVLDVPMQAQDGAGLVVYFDPPPLANGTYTVAWRALSTVDGHETQGTFAFSVGEQTIAGPVTTDAFGTSQPPKALSVFSRWLTFVSMACVVGFSVFVTIVLRLHPEARRDTETALYGLARRSWRAALWLAAIAAVLALLVQAWRNAGGFTDGIEALPDVLSDSRYGTIWLVRIAIIGLLAELTVLLGGRFLRPAATITPPRALVLGLALALPVTLSLNSHAAAGEDLTVLATAADWVHAVGAGSWVGGLLLFLLLLRVPLPGLEPDERPRVIGRVLPRFSALAIAAVVAIVATGVFQWALQVGSIDDTVDSGFGRALIAKTVLLAPMLLLGAMHLFRISPGFRAVVSSARDYASQVHPFEAIFRKTLLIEAVLGVTVLLATGFLTDTAPPSSMAAASAGFSQTQTVGDLDVRLSVDPARAGNNRTVIRLNDRRAPAETVTNMLVRTSFLDQQLGENESRPEMTEPNVYAFEGLQLSIPGRWRVLVIVQREGVEDARATFDVTIAP